MANTPPVRRIRLSDLITDPRNANLGTPRGRAALEDSIRRNGSADAGTIDRNGIILSGNKRAEVYSEAGMDEALVVETDGTTPVFVQRRDVDANTPEGRALAVALNRVAELDLAWDAEVLQELQSDGVDLSGLWTDEEFYRLISTGGSGADDPAVPEPQEPQEPQVESDVLIEIRCSIRDLDQMRATLDEWAAWDGVMVSIA